MRHVQILLAALLALLPLTAVRGENSTSSDGYTIHHNAINTTMLSPDIASRYGIQRSKYRAMLNVAVIQEVAGTTGTPVSAKVDVEAANLLGMAKAITLREVREGPAIYYIGEFSIIDGEIVRFNLKVAPEGAGCTLSAKMHEQFYVDD